MPPSAAPAYGTHLGYLAWVAVPGGDGSHPLAEAPGGTELVVRGGFIIVHTAAASLVTSACNDHVEAAAQPPAGTTAQPIPAAASHSSATKAAPQQPKEPTASAQAAAKAPPLYTKTQAEEGAKIFAQKCVQCHGENLQGTAAPSVAGNDFLQTAQRNGWTLAIIRYLVVNNMPLNSPSSLSPSQYASVMAFLLASNCYPAGNTPFPTSADPAFANVKLGPLPGEHQDENSRGVCKVS